LLSRADNTRFLKNTIHWLLGDDPVEPGAFPESSVWCGSEKTEFPTLIDGRAGGERTIASIERVLRKTGVLKALSRAKWMP